MTNASCVVVEQFVSFSVTFPLAVMNTGGECEDGDNEERSGGFSVCAGLTYLTQLVNTLAFYLDVTLPKKLCYR